jgi:predicted permease
MGVALKNEQANPGQAGTERQAAAELRDERPTPWVESTFQDMRFALRTLRKSPGFTATVLLTLALGIGANTAVFQLLDAVRLRSLPVEDPASLAEIHVKGGTSGFGVRTYDTSLTTAIWEQIRQRQLSFSGMFAWAEYPLSIGRGAPVRAVHGLVVSGDMFSTLGVSPFKGRLFGAEDEVPGCGTPGVVVSYAFWQSEFGGQDSAIGKNLMVQGHPIQILGVTPPSFFGLEVGNTYDVALPQCSLVALDPKNAVLARRDYFWLTVMGRLKPGVTVARASAELESMSPGLMEETLPTEYSSAALDQYRNFRLAAFPAGNGVSWLRRLYDTSLWLLLGITGLVLLIACANLANLLLAKASTREREVAVKLALGATRSRVVRQLLSEGLVLALAGAGLGTLCANVFSRSLLWFLRRSGTLQRLDLSVDWRVLGFTAAIAILTCLIFGLAPAFRSSRADPGSILKTGGRGMTAGRQRFSFQRILVVSQIAFSMVLLAGALLFVQSFWKLMTLDPGFRESGIVLAYVRFDKLTIAPERFEPFKRELLELVRSIPVVESAATTTHVPLDGSSWSLGVRLGEEEGSSKFTWVSPGYFETLQIPILAGRDFNDRDTAESPPVAIVSEKFVQRFFGDVNPLGKTFRSIAEPNFPETQYEIVGVVKDTKYAGLREEIPPAGFVPALQFPDKWYFTVIIIRSSSPPAGVMAAVRQRLLEVNPDVGLELRVFQSIIQNGANGLVRERMMALLSCFFGVLAALLTMIGLYGVISYIIAVRRSEIGVRMALGASRLTVVGMIIRQTLGLLAIGVSLGILLSLVATRGAGSLLFGLGPDDPLTLASAAVFLLGVALVASFVPAYRASRLEPMNTLRHE